MIFISCSCNWLSYFQVSQYTGRIHLYSCISGRDSRPKPLFENFRPEDLESENFPSAINKDTVSESVKDNPAYRHALLEFVNEWNKLRPIEQKKLFGKPLQLPLSVELCYLSENISHNKGVIPKVLFFCNYIFCFHCLSCTCKCFS